MNADKQREFDMTDDMIDMTDEGRKRLQNCKEMEKYSQKRRCVSMAVTACCDA